MQYVAFLHEDKKSVGVSFPDFPGCVTAGRNLDEAYRMAQEALAFHIKGMKEDHERIPVPSSIELLAGEARKQHATMVVVSIDPADVETMANWEK